MPTVFSRDLLNSFKIAPSNLLWQSLDLPMVGVVGASHSMRQPHVVRIQRHQLVKEEETMEPTF